LVSKTHSMSYSLGLFSCLIFLIVLIAFRSRNSSTGKVGPILGYRCHWSECDFIDHQRLKVKEHFIARHTNEQPFSCDKCDAKFSVHRNLASHLENSHTYGLIKKFKCEWIGCQFQTNFREKLNIHYLRHKNIRSFECDFDNCDKKFVTSKELKCHKDQVHLNLRPFPCVWPGCERAFKTKRDLNTHSNFHTGNKPFTCDWPQCGMSFMYRSSFR
jgi:uncharacterized Zn-finger protein